MAKSWLNNNCHYVTIRCAMFGTKKNPPVKEGHSQRKGLGVAILPIGSGIGIFTGFFLPESRIGLFLTTFISSLRDIEVVLFPHFEVFPGFGIHDSKLEFP